MKKSFKDLVEQMEVLQEEQQGQLKGGFSLFSSTNQTVAGPGGGKVTVTVAAGTTCTCTCKISGGGGSNV